MILTRPDGTQETLRLTAQEAMQRQEYIAVALDAEDIAVMGKVGWAWFLTFVIPRIVKPEISS